MKLGAMLSDVIHSLVSRPATRLYPVERRPAPPRLRGVLVWDPAKCSGCQLCAMDCPADALHMTFIDRAAKRFVLRYDAERCTYCGQCVLNCRFGCLKMAGQRWELASTNPQDFVFYFGRPEDVQSVVASDQSKAADAPCED